MPIFTATATALLASTALAGSFIATNLLASGLAYGAGHLLGAFDVPEFDTSGSEDQGVDVRLAASTQNRLPVLYGKWMDRGRLVYAEVSSDKQNYHSVIALGEGPVDSIDKVFWNEYELTLGSDGVVTNATAPDGTTSAQYNGLITVQTYLGTAIGNNSTYLEGLSSVWTSTDKMTNIVYAVVSIKYDREAGVTSLADMRFVGSSPVTNPADAIQNLLTNTRYGLGLSSSDINTASFTAARTYFDEMVNYVDTDGVTVQQTRHTVNGSLSTSNDVVNRVQSIGRGCNTELTWSDGQWGLFTNREDSATNFVFDTSNIVGNIQVVEPGLNSLFNRIEVNFGRNADNNYQRASSFIETPASAKYPNELDRTQSIDLPLVNTSQEAKRVATVNLNQARQQLTVSHTADATAMPLEAGDIVSYTDVDYGWSSKLFRITSITEVNEEASLTYQVTAIEYADAIYDFVVNEDDVAPNVPENDVNAIEAVDDLAVSGQFPAAATPYIALQWTVPENSLIERFNVFYNLVNDTFNSMNTKLGGTELIPVGNYTSGDTVTHQLVGVPAASTVSIWVVASNDFVSSAESNTASVNNWRPTVVTDGVFELITRYNETPSVISGTNIDVGAPPANATGIGTGRNNDSNDTGWYEFDPEASDRENAPVWTATAEAQRSDAEPRVIDFDITGTSATQTTTFTPETQETDFTFSGTVGEREFFYNARPEITDFTLSGQSADFDPGIAPKWGIVPTGSTEATGSDTNDVFYIEPAGTSNTFTGESFTFTPSGDTSDGVSTSTTIATGFTYNTSFSGGDSTVRYIADNGNGTSLIRVDYSTSDIPTAIATMNSLFGTTFVEGTNKTETVINQGVDYSIVVNGTSVVTQTNITSIIYSANGRNFNVSCLITDTTGTEPANNTVVDIDITPVAVQSSVSITLDTNTNTYTLANDLSGGVAIGTALNTAIGTDFTGFIKTFDASTGAITLTADDADNHTSSVAVVAGTNGTLTVAPSSADATGTVTTIRLQVTTESIDETINVGSNLTGSALRTEVFNSFNAITSITDEFTVELVTVDIDGTQTAVVRFTANDFVDHIFMVTVNSGITETTSGTINDGQVAGNATTIRISYDDSITPGFQDLTFGAGDSDNAISELVTLIDGHSNLSAEAGTVITGNSGDLLILNSSVNGVTVDVDSVSANGNENVINTGEFNLTFNNSSSQNNIQPNAALINDFAALDVATQNFNLTQVLTSVNSSGFLKVDLFSQQNTQSGRRQRRAQIIYKVVSISGTSVSVEKINSFYDGFNDTRSSSQNFTQPSSTLYIRRISFYSNIENAYNSANNTTAPGVIITSDNDGVFDVPVVTVTTQGTGDISFEEYIVQNGLATSGTATAYTIRYAGVNVGGGLFTASASNNTMASQINTEINALSQLTSTVTSNVVSATSVANSASNTTVTITQGTNKPGGVSTNDAASVGAVTQVGSAIDVFAGVDSVVNVFNGGELYYTQSYGGDTIIDIVSDVVDGINFDNPLFSNFFTAGVQSDDPNEIVATSDFVGTTPTLTMSVVPGFVGSVDAVGNVSQTQATLAIVRTEVSDGQSDPVVSGTLSTYSVTQGSSEVIAATNIPSGTPFGTVATLISTAISDNSDTIDYTTVVDGGTVETTSTFNDTTPDLTITIVGGTNADTTLPDIALVKTVTQTGAVGTIDLTDATWNYAVTSPTTDGDTTMITSDGTIAVRRGLFLGSLATSDLGEGNNTEVIFETDFYTTASEPSVLDVTGTLHVQTGVTLAAAATDVTFIAGEFQYTDDVSDLANATWTTPTSGVSSPFTLNYVDSTDPRIGTQHSVGLTFAVNDISGLARNTQFAFRMLLRATQSGGFITVPVQVHNGLTGDFLLQEILTV